MAGSGSNRRKRHYTLSARFDESEAKRVRSNAAKAGVAVAALIRQAVLDLPPPRAARRPTVDHQAVARLLGELGKIGSNLNQIAKHANAGRDITDGTVASIELALRDLMELRLICLQALGREPYRDQTDTDQVLPP
jgi:hypothetical protein